ncbi:hypothetical protein T36_1244 [Helicobacter cinaedi]|nr:hypothetical protein T36_1244 [Helicobacter cinaedi]
MTPLVSIESAILTAKTTLGATPQDCKYPPVC